MEMGSRWHRLVEGLADLRRRLCQYHRLTTAGTTLADSELEPAWNYCHERLECVLTLLEDHALMLNRITNARCYFLEGRPGPAVWEVTQVLQRARNLRRLYGYD